MSDQATNATGTTRSRSVLVAAGRYSLIAAGVVALAFAAMIAIGSQLGPGDFNGTNTDLYQADRLYATGLTDEQADHLVDQIMTQADVSHAEAQRIAVSFAQYNLSPELWPKAAVVAKRLASH